MNVVDRVLEVYREPIADAQSPFGWRFASRQTLAPDALVMPLATPDTRISVGDLLP